MPKAFTSQERQKLQRQLMDIGRQLFGRYGYAKTSMDLVCHEARIGKGTLYSFWPNKESYFFACFEEEQQIFQEEVIAPVFQEPLSLPQAFGEIFKKTHQQIQNYPVLHIGMDVILIEQIMRRVSPEVIAHHDEKDKNRLNQLFPNKDFPIPPELMDGVFKALLTPAFHQQFVGEKEFPEVIELLGDLLTAGLQSLSKNKKECFHD
ncbi:MAG: TetR/AcrR family transcriptional regulator [Spirochaetales bacterium]|nr:TetR/AcrR family transcriptional regulator [Spirochaetales bacterium]